MDLVKTILVRLKGPLFSSVVMGGAIGVGDGVGVASWLTSNVGRSVGVGGTAVGVGAGLVVGDGVGVGGTRVAERVGTGAGGTGVGVAGVRLASASAVAAATCVATGVFPGVGVGGSTVVESELQPANRAAAKTETARPIERTLPFDKFIANRLSLHAYLRRRSCTHNPLARVTSHDGHACSAGATTYDGPSHAIRYAWAKALRYQTVPLISDSASSSSSIAMKVSSKASYAECSPESVAGVKPKRRKKPG